MKKWIALGLVLTLAACGGSQKQSSTGETDDDAYSQDDLDRDSEGVYRPSDSGKDDDGVDKGSREKPKSDSTVENKPEPKAEPREDPEPEVKKPKEDPKPESKPEPKPDPKVEDPKKAPEPKVDEPKRDRTSLITGFISNVSSRMDTLEESTLWADFLKAKQKFDDRVDKALEKGRDDKGKDAEAAWANAIQSWYEVRYVYELFLHVNWKASKDFEPGAPLNFDELQVYSDAELKSADCAQTYAAHELAEPEMKEVRQFQTDVLKYDMVASKVYIDPKQEKKWATEKQKWLDATEGKFDDKDIKKYAQ